MAHLVPPVHLEDVCQLGLQRPVRRRVIEVLHANPTAPDTVFRQQSQHHRKARWQEISTTLALSHFVILDAPTGNPLLHTTLDALMSVTF